MRFRLLLLLFLILSTQIYALDRAIYKKRYSNENKTALILGNSDYSHFSKLKNTLNDARDMRDILTKQGFDILYLENGTLREMKKKVRAFAKKLKSGGVGLFYYTGHGVEVEGKNYLIPIGADLPVKDEVEYESLAVNMLINKMKKSKNRLNIVVLDACRVNPFDRGGGGLAQINHAKGMYIAFATAPGEVASDGSGRNGLFTKHLIKAIQKPNLNIEEVFKQTRIGVYNESNEKQSPWSSSNIMGDFYFLLSKTSKPQRESKPQPNPNITTIGNLMWQNEPYTEKEAKAYLADKNVGKVGSWSYATKYCQNLTLGGYSDWRLPTIDELNSLSNISMYGKYDSNWKKWFNKNRHKRATNIKGESYFIRKEFLEKMPSSSWFWTADNYQKSSTQAWVVFFDFGYDGWNGKADSYFVRCVR